MAEITQILSGLDGLPVETERLLPLVYDELRLLAGRQLAGERAGQSLQATALVHEAFLRLLGPEPNQKVWDNRGHFFAAAAEAMRRILVDAARKRNAQKRGGQFARADLEMSRIIAPTNDDEVLAIHDVLDRLAEVDAAAAQLVKLRFFAGMTMSEIANVLQISVRSAHDLWSYARAWLRKELEN